MEDFLEKVGRKLGDTMEELGKKAEEIGKKAEDTIDIQKIKSQINTMKRANERDFTDMGKIIYERFEKGEEVEEEFRVFCEEIEKREDEIMDCEHEISRIKGE